MYSHTENVVIVTARDAQDKPTAWAITGVRDVARDGRTIDRREYRQPIPATRDGTRIA